MCHLLLADAMLDCILVQQIAGKRNVGIVTRYYFLSKTPRNCTLYLFEIYLYREVQNDVQRQKKDSLKVTLVLKSLNVKAM